MRLKSTTHRLWGNNLAHQLSAVVTENGEDGEGYKTKTVTKTFLGTGLFPRRVKKKVYVGETTRKPKNNDEHALRTFRYQCGLKKLAFRRSDGEGAFVAELEGLPKSDFWLEDVSFRFSKKKVKKGKRPIASVRFEGNGPRYGPLKDYTSISARITFRDEAQMAKFVKLPSRRVIRYEGSRYVLSSDGRYRSDDGGSILPWIVMAYLLLPSYSRESFALGNSELTQTFQSFDREGVASPYSDSDYSGMSSDSYSSSSDVGGGSSGGGESP